MTTQLEMHNHYDLSKRYTLNGYVIKNCQKHGLRPPQYEHRQVWASHYGPIPEGYEIHHIDTNKQNNDISNLRCLYYSDHIKLHTILRQSKPKLITCVNCGKIVSRGCKNRCLTCYRHFNKYKTDRSLVVLPPQLCMNNCGRFASKKGLCKKCYLAKWKRDNKERLRAKLIQERSMKPSKKQLKRMAIEDKLGMSLAEYIQHPNNLGITQQKLSEELDCNIAFVNAWLSELGARRCWVIEKAA